MSFDLNRSKWVKLSWLYGNLLKQKDVFLKRILNPLSYMTEI